MSRTDHPSPGRRPSLAVWKFASCDGCQLSLLDCEDELLTLAKVVNIAHFSEMSRASAGGPYDVSLVEGSITTPDDARRILEIRSSSRLLVTIGACATAGGIQGLRNFAASGSYASVVYAHPSTSPLSRRRRPSRPTSRWTMSSTAAPSTGASSSRCSPHRWPAAPR